MSVKMALAKLSAIAVGGAVIGGGAMHVAGQPMARPAQVEKIKKSKAVRTAYHRPKATKRTVKRVRRVLTASSYCIARSVETVNGRERSVTMTHNPIL